jgi:hypothetical protein
LGDLVNPANVSDLNRNGATPFFYRGDDVEIQFAMGEAGQILTNRNNVATFTAQIFLSQNDMQNPQLAVATSTYNSALTEQEWANDTTPFFHATFVFPGATTGLNLNGAPAGNFWLRITMETTDSPPVSTTFIAGPIEVRDGPYSTLSPLPQQAVRLYAVNGQQVLQLLDPSTGLYHTVNIVNISGVLALQLSDQGY